MGLRAAAAVTGLSVLILTAWWWKSSRPENCYRRGRLALATGDRRTALREARQLIGTPGFEPQGRLLSGFAWRQPAEALQELQIAARAGETAVEALTAAAECYYVLGQYLQTIEVSRSALEQDDVALNARRWLASAFYDLGATGNAAEQLGIVSARVPDDPRPDRLMGLINKDNERFAEAVGHYRESLHRNPHQADRMAILVELATSLVKLNRYDEALDTLRECERTAAVLTLEAECKQSLDRADDALDDLREALTVDAAYLPAHLTLGKLYLLKGCLDDAVTAGKGGTTAPARTAARRGSHLSQAYGRRGERDKAAEQLRPLMQQTQTVEREFTDLHEAAAAKPTDADVRYRLRRSGGKAWQA